MLEPYSYGVISRDFLGVSFLDKGLPRPRQLPHTGGDAVHDIQMPWSNNPG